MRTDISKINEQTPHQDLTEGLMLFAYRAWRRGPARYRA